MMGAKPMIFILCVLWLNSASAAAPVRLTAAPISIPAAQSPDECEVPESPLHGTVSPEWTWLQKQNRTDEYLDVTVSCLPPYRPLGDVQVSCHNGQWNGTIAECKLLCKVYPHRSVTYFCEDAASGQWIPCKEFVPSNTVVRPQCNNNYLADGILPPMNCIDYVWDYIATCERAPKE